MNNDNFTVLVSRGGRHHWVSMCTAWPSHSKWLNEESKESATNFALSLNILPWQLPWSWLAASSRQCTNSWITSCAGFFGKTSNHPGDSVPLQPRFGTLQLLDFPKIKITFEREEISDHWWDSGKCNGATNGDWENCVRSRDSYFEGDWDVIVLCTKCLVFYIFFNKRLYFSYYIPAYLLERSDI